MPVRNHRRSAALLLVLATAGSVTALGSGTAAAHGSMQNPLSRVEGCYLEGAEHPKSAACKAAVAAGGTAALYDWMSLRIGDAAGRHRQLIPDGKLCSAGDPVYKGMDLPRADWPATNLVAGADFTFRYRATAPHRGTFQLFATNPSYDPTKPLTWANLESQPFLTVTDPKLVDGSYVLPGKIPTGKTGRQLIYAIWQRSDSPEAFYSCSDVVFDGSGSAPGTAPVPTDTGTGGAHPGGHAHPTGTAPTGAPTGPSTTVPSSAPGTRPATTAVPAGGATTASTAVAAPPAPTGPTGTGGTTPAGAAPAPGTTAEHLAQTGSDRSTGLIASVGSAFLLAGAAMAVIHRKRRGRGAHAR
ncbi:lytic polysaccharide monooxygenase auxiliary activity family 9 protein [Kitasatospora sp. NPDC054939]